MLHHLSVATIILLGVIFYTPVSSPVVAVDQGMVHHADMHCVDTDCVPQTTACAVHCLTQALEENDPLLVLPVTLLILVSALLALYHFELPVVAFLRLHFLRDRQYLRLLTTQKKE